MMWTMNLIPGLHLEGVKENDNAGDVNGGS